MKPARDLFSGKFANYSRYRPGYPKGLLGLMEGHAELTENTVLADIGSGTGILTRLFLENGNTVYAVEPNDEMREYSSATLGSYPGFHPVYGTGESTGLPSNSISIVLCAQAFHWLNPKSAREEFKRILTGKRHVALIWNDRTHEENSFNSDYDSICRRYKKFRPKYNSSERTLIDLNVLDNFFDGSYESLELENHQELNLEGVMGRYSSASYAIGPEESEYGSLLAEMTEAFGKYQDHGIVRIQYVTRIFLGTV